MSENVTAVRNAVASADRGTAEQHHQCLTFTLAGEAFAIGILNIKEIIEYGHVTPVPMVPEFIRGVINLRGAVVPVIDLRSRFGKGISEVTRRTCIVIVEVQNDGTSHDVGVVVDAVNEVLEIGRTEIEQAPAFGANISTEFIAGMGKVNGRFVILLDINRVLSVEELAAATALGQMAEA